MNASADLRAQRLGWFQHVKQLRVVDLQKHTGDLTRQAGVHVLDEGEQTLTWKEKSVTNSLGLNQSSVK